MSSAGSCYIWDLPNICTDCKYAILCGETHNPAQLRCYPAATVDDIKDLSVRDLLNRQPVGSRRWLGRARWAPSPVDDDPLAEPRTPVDSLPPEPDVDEEHQHVRAEDAEDDWRMIQRVLRTLD